MHAMRANSPPRRTSLTLTRETAREQCHVPTVDGTRTDHRCLEAHNHCHPTPSHHAHTPSALSHSLAVLRRVAVHQLAVIWSHSVGSQSHWLAIQARCHRLQGSARSHPLAVRLLAVNGSLYRLAVTVAGISSQSSHSHQLAVISSQSSALSHSLAVLSSQ